MQAPETNFTAVAAALEDVAARNAAAAQVQSASMVLGEAKPFNADDVLRDAPDSGSPVDETDRYSSCCWHTCSYTCKRVYGQVSV